MENTIATQDTPPQRRAGKALAFAATLAAAGSLVGIIGAYSVVKPHLNQDFGLEEDFLGIVDAICFFGRFIGIAYHLIWPSPHPKRTYMLFSISIAITLCFVPLASIVPQYTQILLLLGFLIMGFGRASIVIPIFLANQYFDVSNKSDKVALGIWMSSTGVGDLVGLAIVSSSIDYLKINWQYSFLIYIAVFLLCSIFMCVSLDDIPGKLVPENTTGKQSLRPIMTAFKKRQNILWSIDSATLTSLHYTTLLWMPYYFEKLGFGEYNISITAVFVLCLPIGATMFGMINQVSCLKQKYMVTIFLTLSMLSFLSLIFLGQTQEYITFYLLLLGLGALSMGGPWSYVFSVQLRQRDLNDGDFFWIFNAMLLFCEMFKVFDMAFIGTLMKDNLKSFLYFMFAVIAFNLVFNFLRRNFCHYGEKLGEIQKLQAKENSLKAKDNSTMVDEEIH